MQDQPTKRDQREIEHRLAGMIARLPEQSPPLHMTETVMQRIKPKHPPLSRRWLLSGRRMLLGRPASAVWAVAALAGCVLIAAVVALQLSKPPAITPLAENVPSRTRLVTFTLDMPSAHGVALIGSFNQWNPSGYQMQRENSSGIWHLTVPLAPGQHAYSFLIDNQRIETDPDALLQMEDGFGNRNATIIVANGVHDEDKI